MPLLDAADWVWPDILQGRIPLGACEIETNNPLAKKLKFLVIAGRRIDVTRTIPGILTMGTNTKAQGSTLLVPGTSGSGGLRLKSGSILGGLSSSTVVAWASTSAGFGGDSPTNGLISNSGNAIYAERGSSGNDIYKLCVTSYASTLSAEFAYRNDAGTLLQQRVTDSTINNGQPHFFAIRKDGQTHTVWSNELVSSGTFGSANTAFTDATIESWIGSDKGDSSNEWNGGIDLVFGFAPALTDAEVKSLRQNKLQLFRVPTKLPMSVASASAGGLALDANASATPSASAALSSVIALIGSGVAITSSSSLLGSGSAQLSASGVATPSTTAQASTTITLGASATATPSSTASLTAVGQGLSASATAMPASSAALSTSVRMATSASATPASSAALTAIGQSLSASASATPTGFAQASTAIALGATASAATAETAALLTTIRLSSSVAASTDSAASLSAGGVPWAASNSARTVAAAALTTQILAAASASARTASTATLTGGKPGTPGELILTELKIATITVSALKFATIDAEVLNNG